MKLQDYRDLTDHMLATITDYSACVGKHERATWAAKAAALHQKSSQAYCPRATPRDLDRHNLADKQYRQIT